MQPYAVVIDPLSTGQEYPAVFRTAGYETVAVLSTADPPEIYRASWHPDNFRHIHVFDGDLPALARSLKAYEPRCVIPGTEVGVELAEALNPLVPPGTGTGNDPALATARRDKWHMGEAVRRAGVPQLRQVCATDPDDVESWLRRSGLQGSRLVLKPPRSSATDNVHIVGAGEPWLPYFDQIYGRTNLMDGRNDAVLVQEFAEGTEFLVDSCSADGRHGLVDVCRYTKSRRGDRIGIYDLVDFLPPDHADVAAVWPYTRQVLDALGIRNGCAHSEVILTAAGPRLLEVGARPAGGGHQMITKLATGTNQILRHVAQLTRGEFSEGYELMQHVCSVVISAPRAGVWRNAEIFADVDSLPTYHTEHFYYGGGDVVPAAGALFDMLGWVVLASTDAAAIEADYRRIKYLERLIEVEPVQPVGTR
jgi:biotin carboxylase